MCGVFGIWGHPEAANLTYLGLHALQHRGQESVGIASTDGVSLFVHKSMGLVADAFSPQDLEALRGSAAVGHVRYSTSGGSHIRNAQPIAIDYVCGSIAVAHNGNLTNASVLRSRLELEGAIFVSNSDTEVIVHLIARSVEPSVEGRLKDALAQVQGAFSLVFLTESSLVAVRDPHGFRPLCIGEMPSESGGKAIVVASEGASFNLLRASFLRELEPGEMLVVDKDGMRSVFPFAKVSHSTCVFELVYFARPDSSVNGRGVYAARHCCGERLAEEAPVCADVVIPVPDSGVPAALGFAKGIGIPFEMGLLRSHYVGRTFIEPRQSIRHFGVRVKFSAVRSEVAGKRVVVVDDSLVRGTTMRKIVEMVREAGAREVHVRIASPPTVGSCYYGIDTPTREELISARMSVDQVREHLGASSLAFLSREGLLGASGGNLKDGRSIGLCDACFSGDYPVPVDPEVPPRRLRLVGI